MKNILKLTLVFTALTFSGAVLAQDSKKTPGENNGNTKVTPVPAQNGNKKGHDKTAPGAASIHSGSTNEGTAAPAPLSASPSNKMAITENGVTNPKGKAKPAANNTTNSADPASPAAAPASTPAAVPNK